MRTQNVVPMLLTIEEFFYLARANPGCLFSSCLPLYEEVVPIQLARLDPNKHSYYIHTLQVK